MSDELEAMDYGESEAHVHLKKSISYIDLNSTLVTQYLDAHPEFLNEYLRKSQIQRRMTVLNDKNSGTILEKLRIQTQLNDLNPENINTLSLSMKPVLDSKKCSVSQLEVKNPLSFPQYELLAATSEPSLTPVANYSFDTLFDRQRKKEKREQERRVFKQLGLHEKMFTLVKTLYQSLDLKTTCKKILNTVSLLLDADRCSLFLVVDDETSDNKKYLISVVFDAQSSNSIKHESYDDSGDNQTDSSESEIDEQIRIPYGKGIAGYVASTGETLNIQDAYRDPRFNPSIDTITGYRTKSILCLPILDEHGQCVGVAEAINKSSDFYEGANVDERLSDLSSLEEASASFNKQDEEVN